MQQKVILVVLLVGVLYGSVVLCGRKEEWRLPDNQQGYAPEQPISYSHQLHAGELGIDCQFCHSGAASSRHAGIPSSEVCMKCHKSVTCSFDVLEEERKLALEEKREPKPIISEKLQKLYDTLGIEHPQQPFSETGEALQNESPSESESTPKSESDSTPKKLAKSIPWVKVHNLPDYVYFDHRAHVTAESPVRSVTVLSNRWNESASSNLSRWVGV